MAHHARVTATQIAERVRLATMAHHAGHRVAAERKVS